MRDDGHADRIRQLTSGQTLGSSAVISQLLGKLKRSTSSNKLKGEQTTKVKEC